MQRNLWIIENGTQYVEPDDPSPSEAPTSVLAQSPAESPAYFAARVRRWIHAVRDRGIGLGRVVLHCRDAWEVDVLRARLSVMIAVRADGEADDLQLVVAGNPIGATTPISLPRRIQHRPIRRAS